MSIILPARLYLGVTPYFSSMVMSLASTMLPAVRRMARGMPVPSSTVS